MKESNNERSNNDRFNIEKKTMRDLTPIDMLQVAGGFETSPASGRLCTVPPGPETTL